jgi:hypothetical protein
MSILPIQPNGSPPHPVQMGHSGARTRACTPDNNLRPYDGHLKLSTAVEDSVSDQVLLRDLVAIPDTVHDGDFVLTLSKGV